MNVTAQGDATTLLDYGISSDPQPLEATLTADDTTTSAMQIVISNGSANPIWCEKITFTLPVGTAASDLCDSAAAAQMQSFSVPAGRWQIAQTAPGVFVATPLQNSYREITSAGLGFILYNIQVNQQVGNVTLSVQEQSSTDGTNYSEHIAMYKLPKFPAGFYVNNFAASSPMVQNGNTATLTWNGSRNARYVILYGNQSVDVTEQRSWTSPSLHTDTAFILQASAQQNGETVNAYLSVVVNVKNPQITATSLNVLQAATVQGAITVDGVAALAAGANVTGTLQAGTVNANSAQLGALNMNGQLTAQGVSVGGALQATGSASVLKNAVTLFANQQLGPTTPSRSFRFTAHTDGLIYGTFSAPPGGLNNVIGSATITIQPGNVTVGPMSCAGLLVANIWVLVAQPMIVPALKDSVFTVSINLPSGARSPLFTFNFIPLGLSGNAAVTPN